MKWNIYIAHKIRHGEYGSTKHVIEVPNTHRSDGAAVTVYAARHFRVPQDKVLALPQPASEARVKAQAIVHGNMRNTRGRFTRARRR